MGRLTDFLGYLRGRRRVLSDVENRLCMIQQKYETFFQEVQRVREAELGQLTACILAARAGTGPPLPEAVSRALTEAHEEVERELAQKLKKLHAARAALEKKAEALRQLSIKAEAAVHEKNVELDREEEALKARNAELLARIAAYNGRIRAMGKGFGFFANLLRMRALARERAELTEQQADVTARIEQLRARWQQAEQGHFDEEKERGQRWVELQTELSALGAKIDHLEQSAAQIRLRSTVERVLFVHRPDLPEPKESDPVCPRCGSHNARGSHFCHICANRLVSDRPDFEGSLEEIAELNRHHELFQEGVKACQEIIGLVRGLISGLEAFEKSVEDVLASERKYPLPALNIDVPPESRALGAHMEKLLSAASADLSVHPRILAARVRDLVGDVLTEKNIKSFFETMGQELSRQADAQW